MKKFAIAFHANTIANGKVYSHLSIDTIKAISKKEAKRIGSQMAKGKYKKDEGWNSHDVKILEL